MKTTPIVPARWRFSEQDGANGPPFSDEYQDLYHARAGALVQARDVFLAGNGLPERWRGRERFVVLEAGFGLGSNFLATWDAWRQENDACRQLHFISIERHPLTRADLECVHRDSPLQALSNALIAAWPPLTPNLHRLSFEGGRVQLLLALGDVAAMLPQVTAQVDAFFLDGFAPARNPAMWQDRLFKAMARLAQPGATVATWTASQAVRSGLQAAGFSVQAAQGTGEEREVTLARFEPPFQPRRAKLGRNVVPSTIQAPQRAMVVGGGLAGCAAAWALAEQGWETTVFDRHASPAREASGNPAGLFHGIVNPQDGAHARFNRTAALEARSVVQRAIADCGVLGSGSGLLRLEPGQRDFLAMQRLLWATGLPADYVQAVSIEQASALCGLALEHPAWFYPGGGWVAPGALAGALLGRAGTNANFRGNVEVQSIHLANGGWELRDPQCRTIDAAETLVLANAFDALRLLGSPAWPVQKVRGQISLMPAGTAPALPTLPLAGAGYLLPAVLGRAVFGATAQPGDEDPSVRQADHEHNLAQLVRLGGSPFARIDPAELQGRTAWRMVSGDRLPIVGAVPDLVALNAEVARGRRFDQPRRVPRLPGLYVLTGLGSRGITWSPLAAQVLASSITGAPQPLEADLLDAIDPARFIARSMRRSSGAA
jgi:tRNA 5-methylaminomethyl-2-thiouridine biosynthesis bifunctional protein